MRYFFLFIVLFIVLKAYIKLAKLYNIVDHPNSRSSHSKITVRGGGIIFPVGAITWFIFSGFQFPIFFLGLILISTISFLDDIKQLSPKIRLTFQLVAISLLLSELGFWQFDWWLWIIVLIIATGTINAFNFMDGINGITGGYSLAVVVCLWMVNTFQVEFISNEFIFFIAISVLVFCLFNFRKKAICFAGDVGAISIAFILIFLLVKLIIQTKNPLYLLFIGIYGVDSIITILYRIWHKENIFEAHRKHIYQLMANELKIPHIPIAAIYSILQLLICLIVFFIIKAFTWSVGLYLGLGTLGILILLFYVTRLNINKKLNKQ